MPAASPEGHDAALLTRGLHGAACPRQLSYCPGFWQGTGIGLPDGPSAFAELASLGQCLHQKPPTRGSHPCPQRKAVLGPRGEAVRQPLALPQAWPWLGGREGSLGRPGCFAEPHHPVPEQPAAQPRCRGGRPAPPQPPLPGNTNGPEEAESCIARRRLPRWGLCCHSAPPARTALNQDGGPRGRQALASSVLQRPAAWQLLCTRDNCVKAWAVTKGLQPSASKELLLSSPERRHPTSSLGQAMLKDTGTLFHVFPSNPIPGESKIKAPHARSGCRFRQPPSSVKGGFRLAGGRAGSGTRSKVPKSAVRGA